MLWIWLEQSFGFVDDAVSPAATKLQNAIVSNVGKIDPKMPAQIMGQITIKVKLLGMLNSPASTKCFPKLADRT